MAATSTYIYAGILRECLLSFLKTFTVSCVARRTTCYTGASMAKQPTDLREIAPVYERLIEEIKRRVDVILRVVGNQVTLPKMVAFELGYLQLRKICEVFALACLCAHGDIPDVHTKQWQEEYDASDIIKHFTRLNSDFYPLPGKQACDPVTGRPLHVDRISSGYLTKDELLKLYGECGNYLHRGNIRQLLTTWEPAPEFSEIETWVKRITTLLNHHQIQTGRPDIQLWVLMQSREDGRVHSAIMQRQPSKNK